VVDSHSPAAAEVPPGSVLTVDVGLNSLWSFGEKSLVNLPGGETRAESSLGIGVNLYTNEFLELRFYRFKSLVLKRCKTQVLICSLLLFMYQYNKLRYTSKLK